MENVYTLTHTGSQVDDAVEQSLHTSDYIVERNSSGIWTYEKWNSGFARCYATPLYTSQAFTKRLGFAPDVIVSPSHYENFPSGLFIDKPVLEISISESSWPVIGIYNNDNVSSLTKDHTGEYAAVGAGVTTTGYNVGFALVATGRWK